MLEGSNKAALFMFFIESELIYFTTLLIKLDSTKWYRVSLYRASLYHVCLLVGISSSNVQRNLNNALLSL